MFHLPFTFTVPFRVSWSHVVTATRNNASKRSFRAKLKNQARRRYRFYTNRYTELGET